MKSPLPPPSTPGFYTGIPFESYLEIPRINWSTLRAMERSPRHYIEATRPQPAAADTAARRLGRALHWKVLEPLVFANRVTSWNGKRVGRDWKRFAHVYRGWDILTQAEWNHCITMAEAIRFEPTVAPLLLRGRSELTLLWDYVVKSLADFEGYSIAMKSRIDWVSEDERGQPQAILDLKSTRDASPEGFGKEAATYCYPGQAALYLDAFRSLTGLDLPYYLVAAEKVPPYVVQLYRVQGAELEWGRDLYRGFMGKLRFCQLEDRWDGYASAPLPLQLPRWVLPEEAGSALGLEFDEDETTDQEGTPANG